MLRADASKSISKTIDSILIEGRTIPLSWKYDPLYEEDHSEDWEKIKEMKGFKDWCSKIANINASSGYVLKSIQIQDYDKFGPRIGFLKLKAEIHDSENSPIPGIVFIRGDSVAMLMILIDEDGHKHTIFLRQPRAATGEMNFPEIPAGMMDNSGDFAGTAAKEIKEETGIIIHASDMMSMTFNHPNGLFPSPGGCDEAIKIYLFIARIRKEDLNTLKGTRTGNAEEGETITVDITRYENLHLQTNDMKTICACYLYDNMSEISRCTPTLTRNGGYVQIKKP
jgi:ADP-sugar diphosphatase